MDDYDIEASLVYLKKIYGWSNENHSRSNITEPILIGGWAVDCFNSWFGSQDIDLIVNSRTESSLKYYLRTNEGFSIKEDINGERKIYTEINGNREIHVDFISKKMPFEGKTGTYLESNKHISSTAKFPLRGRVQVKIPSITDVWIYKLKAAWDRNYRLDEEKSRDIEWETSKLSKDYSDIVSLIDADESLDLTIIIKRLTEFPFLKEVLDLLNRESRLYASYIRLSHADEAKIKMKISTLVENF